MGGRQGTGREGRKGEGKGGEGNLAEISPPRSFLKVGAYGRAPGQCSCCSHCDGWRPCEGCALYESSILSVRLPSPVVNSSLSVKVNDVYIYFHAVSN